MDTLNLDNISIVSTNLTELREYFLKILANNLKPALIITFNLEFYRNALINKEFNSVCQRAELILPDGISITHLLKLKYKKKLNRVTGNDIFEILLSLSMDMPLKVAFVGSSESVIQDLSAKVSHRFPNCKIAAAISPTQFFEKNEPENNLVVEMLKKAKPDVLFLALGNPRQEIWLDKYRNQIGAKINVGVGAVFDFYTGYKRRSPEIFQKLSLEWAWRLMNEPKRLYKRYLIYGIPFFIKKITQEFFRNEYRLKSESRQKNKKILYLVKSMEVGGAERFTLNLAKYFATRNLEVTVASLGGIFVEELQKNGIQHICLKTNPIIINLIPLSLELSRIIKEGNYTVIHCQHRIFNFILQFQTKRKFRLVYTAHNVFYDLFQKMIFPDAAATVSETIKLNLMKTSYIKESRISRINNGVPIPNKSRPVNNIITFGFLGRLIKVKGLFNLLEAIKILSKVNIEFKVILRGTGETEKINDYIIKNNLNKFIRIAPVSHDEEEIYKNIDVLLLPTKMNEGMPLSILEAAARRILVVSTRAGGIEDFIVNESTGILLESTEPEKLAAVLKNIICNRDSYKDVIENAFRRVENEFSLNQMATKYEELYSRELAV